jgi:hypothetical protein
MISEERMAKPASFSHASAKHERTTRVHLHPCAGQHNSITEGKGGVARTFLDEQPHPPSTRARTHETLRLTGWGRDGGESRYAREKEGETSYSEALIVERDESKREGDER